MLIFIIFFWEANLAIIILITKKHFMNWIEWLFLYVRIVIMEFSRVFRRFRLAERREPARQSANENVERRESARQYANENA